MGRAVELAPARRAALSSCSRWAARRDTDQARRMPLSYCGAGGRKGTCGYGESGCIQGAGAVRMMDALQTCARHSLDHNQGKPAQTSRHTHTTHTHLRQVVGQQLQRLVPVRGAVDAPQRAQPQRLQQAGRADARRGGSGKGRGGTASQNIPAACLQGFGWGSQSVLKAHRVERPSPRTHLQVSALLHRAPAPHEVSVPLCVASCQLARQRLRARVRGGRRQAGASEAWQN